MRFDTDSDGPHELARGDAEALDLELLLGHPQHQDERRVQAQRLLDGRLEPRHLPQRLVAHLLAVRVELVELGHAPPASASGWRSSSISVQAAVPEVVWWPANIIEMNMPVTLSVEKRGVPSSLRIDMSTSSRSRSSSVAAGPSARAVHDPLDERHQPEAGRVAPGEALDLGAYGST